ncbi:hypothetical protein ACA910_005436 [Epithemia clementina (nom. ined.)]
MPRRPFFGFPCAADMILFMMMLLSFSSLAVTHWMQHAYFTYWHPPPGDDDDHAGGLYSSLLWTEARQEEEMTYYARACDAIDLSTTTARDLDWSDDNDNDHQDGPVQHGFSRIRNALSPDTAHQLRDYILQRNAEIGKDYHVLENDYRYSFGLDPSASHVVALALEEVTRSNGPLSKVVEQVMGPNPALIELTAITSTYGAVAQYFHDDVVSHSSSLLYARTFTPMWSIFLQLQPTTAAMGATGVCPGMQFCSLNHEQVERVCQRHGFALVDDQDHDPDPEDADDHDKNNTNTTTTAPYWSTGDALLMNMNAYHRGGAHVDPHAPDRVMLVITLAPQPRPRAESRQVSHGTPLCLRHDLWGHTWSDLQQASTIMQKPWSILRSYGLWNIVMGTSSSSSSSSWSPPPPPWGYDMISILYMRIANDPNFFNADTLVEMTDERSGIFAWLPTWLYPTALLSDQEMEDEDVWYHYFRALLQRIYVLHVLLVLGAAVAYLFFHTMNGWLGNRQWSNRGTTNSNEPPNESGVVVVVPGFKSAFLRLSGMALVLYVGFVAARRHLDSTQWAKDVRNGRLYTSVMDHEGDFADMIQEGWTTLPTRYDVLVEHRLGGSQYLGMLRDMIHKGHYGNARFQNLMDRFSGKQSAVLEFAKNDVTSHFWDTLRHNGHAARFLEQGTQGKWFLMSQGKALAWMEKALMGQVQYPILNVLSRQTLLPMISEWRYGIYRSSALARKHAAPVLQALERRLFATAAAQMGRTRSSPSAGNGRVHKPSLARPVPMVSFLSEDGSIVLNGPPSPTNSSGGADRLGFSPRRFAIPEVPGVSVVTTPRRVEMGGSSLLSKPDIRVVKEPSYGDWLHTGSYVEGKLNDFWYTGRIVHVFPDSFHEVRTMEGVLFFAKHQIRPLHPLMLLLDQPHQQQVQVRLVNNNNSGDDAAAGEDSFFETCQITNVYYSAVHDKDDDDDDNEVGDDPYGNGNGKLLADLKFQDGEVMEGVDILLLRRGSTSLDQHQPPSKRSAYGPSSSSN